MSNINETPTIVMVGVLGAFFTLSFKALGSMTDALTAVATPQTVFDNADLIVDRTVSAQTLQEKGYRIENSTALAKCRQDVLTESFNKGLSNQEKAMKINTCIYFRQPEPSAEKVR